jgi:signal peptidase II
MRSAKAMVFAAVLPLLLGFDFASKRAVEASLPVGGEIQVIPGWLSVLHAENPDVAFSVPVPLPLIAVFGLVAVGWLLWSFAALPREARFQSAGIAAILAGALGNLIDRIGDGSVTDFVRVYTTAPALSSWLVQHFGTATWPIFNIADASIFVGVVLWAVPFVTTPDEPADGLTPEAG